MEELERGDLESKKKDLALIADKIRKAQKDSAVVLMHGDKALLESVDFISTGSWVLDDILGGGMPRGRIVELYGLEGGGKTSIALSVISQAQKKGYYCHYIDAENSFVAEWAKNLGVNLDFLLLSQLNCTQDVFNLIENSIDSGVNVVVVDSLAALSPREELEGEVGDWHVGLQARLVGQGLRKLSDKAGKAGALIIFINQIRQQVGVMFGNPETTPGGRALKFFSSVRLDVRSRGHLKAENGAVVGIVVHATVIKNKIAIPFRKAEIDFYFNRGFDNESSMFDLALSKGVITRRGSYYVFPLFDNENRRKQDWVQLFKTNAAALKLLYDEMAKKKDAGAVEVSGEVVEDEISDIQ
jgi:recombination protein RecA